MGLRPATSFCGCASLVLGVELTCLATLITNIVIIAVVSSEEPLQVAHIELPPSVQVLFGTWALIGLPIVVVAGVGAYYRIEGAVRALFWYLLASFFISLSLPLTLLFLGSLCTVAIPDEVQRMGASFVCGFADTFVFMWTLIFGVIELYLVYIAWSMAEEISMTPFPELVKYTDALRNVRIRPANQGASFAANAQTAAKAAGPTGPSGVSGPQQPPRGSRRSAPKDLGSAPPPAAHAAPAVSWGPPAGDPFLGNSSQRPAFEGPPPPSGFTPAPPSPPHGSGAYPTQMMAPGPQSFVPGPPRGPEGVFGTRMMSQQPQSFVPAPASGADFSSRHF